uniref:Uncharacterized protein n=1 Tax=Arundo donax TaxID=35708 RepID=A0A0A9QJ22_ARUDO
MYSHEPKLTKLLYYNLQTIYFNGYTSSLSNFITLVPLEKSLIFFC